MKFFSNVILLLTMTSLSSCASLKNDVSELPQEAYDVLNDFYEGTHPDMWIYYKTEEEPAYEQLFVYDSIFPRVTIPTTISDEELKTILSEDDLRIIRSRIKKSRPTILNEDELKNIRVKRRHMGRTNFISRPIILDDVAIFRRIGELEVPIHILIKENDKWEVKYTFYQKLVFY